MNGDEPRPDDARARIAAGLQAERTALAWDRTALTVGGVGVLLARAAGGVLTWAWIVAVLVTTTAAVGLLLGRTRYVRRDSSMRAGGVAPSHRLIAAAGVASVLTSLAAVAAVIGLTVRGA